MKHGIKGLIAFLLLLQFSTVQAVIYQWTDSDGNVNFSDTPHEGAKQLDLPQAQSYDPKKLQQRKSSKPTPAPELVHAYESITITQPANESTVPNMEGNVNVTVEILPKLADGDSVQLLLDGKPVGGPQTSSAFSLTNVNRGAHKVSANIINKNNKVIIKSNAVTFHVRRPVVSRYRPFNQDKKSNNTN